MKELERSFLVNEWSIWKMASVQLGAKENDDSWEMGFPLLLCIRKCLLLLLLLLPHQVRLKMLVERMGNIYSSSSPFRRNVDKFGFEPSQEIFFVCIYFLRSVAVMALTVLIHSMVLTLVMWRPQQGVGVRMAPRLLAFKYFSSPTAVPLNYVFFTIIKDFFFFSNSASLNESLTRHQQLCALHKAQLLNILTLQTFQMFRNTNPCDKNIWEQKLLLVTIYYLL